MMDDSREGQVPRPTSVAEIFVWLAILIYIGLHKEIAIRTHWKTSEDDEQPPRHPIVKFMTHERFSFLYRRLRPYDKATLQLDANDGIAKNFKKVNAWSLWLQEASTKLFKPGTNIAVDECIIRFTGRARETVTIKTKPTPTGFKVWAVAQRGYFLRWLFHTPYSTFGPVARRATQTRAGQAAAALNPTQSVVVALVNLLPEASYHVFLDNLFCSPKLFGVLRQRGIGATGTCRTNCGLSMVPATRLGRLPLAVASV